MIYSPTKPNISTRIDWSDPLSQGLVGCFLFNEGGGKLAKNLANGAMGDFQLFNVTHRPTGVVFNGTSSYGVTTKSWVPPDKFSFFYKAYFPAFTNNDDIFLEHSVDFSINARAWYYSLSSGFPSTGKAAIAATPGDANFNHCDFTRPVTGWQSGAVLSKVVNTIGTAWADVYINAKKQVVTPVGGYDLSIPSGWVYHDTYLGARAGTSLFTSMTLSCLFFYNRNLSTNEILQLHEMTKGW